MIGIYKITNKINGKCYIGQSNNCERRFKEHQTKGSRSRIPVDVAIKKYGKDTFTYEIIEECSIEELNSREQYWITYYDSIKNGYNCSEGGNQQSIGENNGRAKLTEKDIIEIRQAYNNHLRQKDVYQKYKDIISFGYFQNVWQGQSWKHIMPEVFTKENKEYYIFYNSKGERSEIAQFSNDEVIEIRKRYVKETAANIYKDYCDRITFQGFQSILWGRVYKDLPIYKKKEKKWINTEPVSTIS